MFDATPARVHSFALAVTKTAGALLCGAALTVAIATGKPSHADDTAVQPNPASAPPAAAQLSWHNEYATARESAKKNRRMLLILFTDSIDAEVRQTFLEGLENDSEIRSLLERYERAWLTRKSSVRVGSDEVPLLEHDSFRDMLGRTGLAVVDFRDPQSRFYHQVVSVYPFGTHDAPRLGNRTPPPQVDADGSGRPGAGAMGPWISLDEFGALLDLPDGSLTQRTLIFAVRTHPDGPSSADGELSELLMSEAESHSRYQAELRVQGHHNWGSRFQRINNLLPGNLLAQEVCAESWPGQTLLDAARECVRSWRQSDGHWNAVQRRHRLFGYDMKAGSNGVWYATGIFGRHR